MASGFPGSIDNFTDPLANSSLASPSHAGQHADLNDAVEKIETYMGLVKVIPNNVTSSGGTSATLAANGTITIGSGNTLISIFGCFSSLYRNYKIVWTANAQSTTANFLAYMNASASGVYYTNGMYMQPGSTTVNGYQLSAQNSTVIGVWLGGFAGASGSCDIHSPFAADRTFFISQAYGPGYMWWGGGQVADTASNVNLYLAPSAGTVSGGSIVIYGYRN
jgi:hypothetical protein